MRNTAPVICGLLLTGCLRLGFDEEPSFQDASQQDLAREWKDSAAEGPDLTTVPMDQGPRDIPAVDQTKVDQTKVDQTKPDKSIPDKSIPNPDLPQPDLPADAPVTGGPCATGGSVVKYFTYKMALCSLPSTVNQCGAAAGCGVTDGWQLCTAAEYLASGGKSGGAAQMAWIGGCVRSNGGKPSAPSNVACNSCSTPLTAAAQIAWACGGGVPGLTTSANVGLVAAMTCKRVGVNNAVTEGFWSPLAAEKTSKAVMCCKP